MDARTRYGVRVGGRIFALTSGAAVLGRAPECDVVVHGSLVSRRHARLSLASNVLAVEDLESTNGTLLDDAFVLTRTRLAPGMKLVLGDAVVEVLELEPEVWREARVARRPSRAAPTPHSRAPTRKRSLPAPAPIPTGEDVITERRPDGLEVLAAVANKALVLGHVDQAEHVLTAVLADIEHEVRAGIALPESVTTQAARSALMLAKATGKPAWVNYALRLFHALRAPLPLELVDQIYENHRCLPGIDPALFADYLAMLQARNSTASERFTISRLEGLASRVFS